MSNASGGERSFWLLLLSFRCSQVIPAFEHLISRVVDFSLQLGCSLFIALLGCSFFFVFNQYPTKTSFSGGSKELLEKLFFTTFVVEKLLLNRVLG